jgi:competence protein ComEC
MISIMLLAVLLDRPALALRNVALAALIILVITPESLIDVGFQMSFAAVTALVAGYEVIRARREAGGGAAADGGMLRMIGLMIGGILVSTVIASFSVAPFAAYHFHKSQQYALIANLMAVPICNLVVMPAALATLIAMPFGLEAWPLHVMGIGIDAMVWCAYRVAALPGAVAALPAFSAAALAVMVAGGLWLLLWRRSWRWAGIPVGLAGLGLAVATVDRPSVLVGREGALVAVRGKDGQLAAVAARGSAFDLSRWLEYDGDRRPAERVVPDAAFVCDGVGCTARIARGRVLSVARHASAFRDDCVRATVLVTTTPTPPPRTCRGPIVLTRQRLRRAGTHAIRIARDGRVEIENVADRRGRRHWSRRTADIAPDGE